MRKFLNKIKINSNDVSGAEIIIGGPELSSITGFDFVDGQLVQVIRLNGKDPDVSSITSLNAEFFYFEGEAKFKSGLYSEAITNFEKALQLDSSYEKAAKALKSVQSLLNSAPKIMAKALYSSQAENEGELTFTQGSLLEVLEEDNSGWWRCRQGTQEGFVPSNYLEKVSSSGFEALVSNSNIESVPQVSQEELYEKGCELKKQGNHVEAFGCFLESATLGHPGAQHSVGACYANGWGATKNKDEAVLWLLKAAGQKYAPAQFRLGVCYEKGDGVTKDEAEALKWYRKAAAQKYSEALSKLKQLDKMSVLVQKPANNNLIPPSSGLNPISEPNKTAVPIKRDSASFSNLKPMNAERLSSPSITPPLPSSPSASRLNDAWKIKHADVQLEQQIGSGGCGVVYQGRWQGIKVAVKQLHGGLNQAALDEFQQEAQLAASLQHDHVVQLYGITQEAPFYMVMKYMGKGSLYDVLRQEDLRWETRVKFGLQVARGLSFLHDKGIIHRDVKSMNVLVSKKDDIKLSDFGLSKVKQSTRSVSKKSGADGSVGTLHWKAPELFKMGAKHTCASDIYSLGVLLWELSTGRLPYEEAEDESQIMAHVLGGNREEINLDAPAFLNTLIEQCWAQNPADRPTLAQVIETLRQGISQLKGKPMSPQVSANKLTPSTPPLLNSGDYRGVQQSQFQQPFLDSGNYLMQGQQSPVQGRGPSSPTSNFQQPVAPGQPGLWGNSQGRSPSPLLSGDYRQRTSQVSNNNNNLQSSQQPQTGRKF